MYTRRVLILEDDEGVGKIAVRIAESSGYEAHLVSDPELFFGALEDVGPALILLDLMVPHVDGAEILTGLSKRGISAKIIIMSGMGERALDAAASICVERGLDVVGLLAKPFSTGALRGLLVDTLAVLMPPTARQTAVRNGNDFERSLHTRESELRRAMEHGLINLAYRPKIECATGRLAGLEAVAEWTHPRQGIMVIDQFILDLADIELVGEIVGLVFDKALLWFSGALENCHGGSGTDVSLTIAVSTRTLVRPQFIEGIVARCRTLGIAPPQLVIEFSEGDLIADPKIGLDLTTRLRKLGFGVSIGDFGTVHLQVGDLDRLRLSEIKVDESHVMRAYRSAETRALLSMIANLGRTLGLASIADGVEDVQTLEYLKQIGFDMAQGRLIAPPMDGPTFCSWVSGRPLIQVRDRLTNT